jgi:hypothetical protein
MTFVNKPESKWQTEFNQYLRESKMPGFFELKIATGKSFPFSKIEPHQYEGLQATEKNGLVWKNSDMDIRLKPCDTFAIPPLPSYLVIKFSDGFYCIRIGEIVNIRDTGVVGISLQKAKEVAEKIITV